jgi:hypothetical protein
LVTWQAGEHGFEAIQIALGYGDGGLGRDFHGGLLKQV